MPYTNPEVFSRYSLFLLSTDVFFSLFHGLVYAGQYKLRTTIADRMSHFGGKFRLA